VVTEPITQADKKKFSLARVLTGSTSPHYRVLEVRGTALSGAPIPPHLVESGDRELCDTGFAREFGLIGMVESGGKVMVYEVGEHMTAQKVGRRLAQKLHHLPTVESIFVQNRPWGFECWVVANQIERGQRFSLYDSEWELMEQFPGVGLKFHLLDRRNRALAGMVTLDLSDAIVQVHQVSDAHD